MQFGDLKELLPSSEGSVRRRMLAGFLVLGSAVPVVWTGSLKELLASSGLENATVALGALLVVYSIGLLSEIIGETVLLRAFGGAIWALEFPLRGIQAHTPAACWVLRGMAYYFVVPVYAFWESARGLFGKTGYVSNVHARLLTEGARGHFDRLPLFVQVGLSQPYGNGFDTALQHLSSTLSETHRSQIHKLHVRNLETLALVSALSIVLAAYFGLGVIKLRAELDSALMMTFGSLRLDVPAALLPLMILLPVAVLAIHHRYTMSAVVNAVELLALEKAALGSGLLSSPGGTGDLAE